jgi:hypothetical protein
MEKNILITKAAIEMMSNKGVTEEHVGFPNILKSLVEEGEVLFPIHSPNLENHLLTFPFVIRNGLAPDLIDIVKFSFDREAFEKSPLFVQYAFKKAKELSDESSSLMNEAVEKQNLATAKHMEACALLASAGLLEEDELKIDMSAPAGMAERVLERASKETRTVHPFINSKMELPPFKVTHKCRHGHIFYPLMTVDERGKIQYAEWNNNLCTADKCDSVGWIADTMQNEEKN